MLACSNKNVNTGPDLFCQWFPYPKNLIVCRIQCFLLHSGFSFSQIGRIRYEVTLNIPKKQSTSSLWRKYLFRGERGGWYWDRSLTGQIDSSSCPRLPDSGTEQQRYGTPATCAHSLVKTGCSLECQRCYSHYCTRLQHCRWPEGNGNTILNHSQYINVLNVKLNWTLFDF